MVSTVDKYKKFSFKPITADDIADIKTLKCLQIGKCGRENWAKAIYHMLDCLATASNKDVRNIWFNLVAMVFRFM